MPPPHLPDSHPFLPASKSQLWSGAALPTPGDGYPAGSKPPQASSWALQKARGSTSQISDGLTVQLSTGLSLQGCQAGLEASPSIPSKAKVLPGMCPHWALAPGHPRLPCQAMERLLG